MESEELNQEEIQNYKQAGKIASKVKVFAKSIIKKDKLLAEIAEAIESKITELGAEVAFPVNLSINEIAAHYTPTLDDETLASGLLKIDIGIHINGFIADTAFTLDLENSEQNKKLIQATEQALQNAQKLVQKNKQNTIINEIGQTIHKTITGLELSPIINLSGHSLDKYTIHAGETIPNYDNNNTNIIEQGAFAIEPFATTGQGKVIEGKGSTIYRLVNQGQVRDQSSREVLAWLLENKLTLPFSLRELQRQFKNKARLAVRRLTEANIIEEYPQLVEISGHPVSQAENTLIITKDKVEVTSE
jgi:methionyl aminopeptidase